MHNDDHTASERALVSTRTMDIVAALLFLLGSGIVLYDAVRLGFGWLEGEGPAPGYFPFYLGLIMGIASIINLVRAVLRLDPGSDGIFVSTPAFGRVLTILVPALLYVAFIGGIRFGWTATIGGVEVPIGIPRLGMYVSSAIFIFVFMVVVGRESILKALGVAIIAPIALFLMFEKWFLVPLPKGPLETWLGY
jgi:putative tricarboxylic transport membrane protein